MGAARRPFVCGNWKCHKTVGEALELARELRKRMGDERGCEVGVAPAFTALHAVRGALNGSRISVCAQDVFWEPSGAWTGEVSAPMLAEVGCAYVIVGHSERRQHFGETDATVNKKTRAVLAAGLGPIVCVGELLAEREGGKTMEVVTRQIRDGLAGLTADEGAKLVVAYEPVWAIGTGKTATPEQAQEVHAVIRSLLAGLFGAKTADALRIQYGGSVKPDNAAELMSRPDVDGALVGGASLKSDDFARIVAAAAAAAR
jgi:triosephosphate isomerase